MRSLLVALLLTGCGALAGQDAPADPGAATGTAATAAPAAAKPGRLVLGFHAARVGDAARFFSDVLGQPIDVAAAAERREIDIEAKGIPSDASGWAFDQALKAQGLALWEGERRLSIGVTGPPPAERSGAVIFHAVDGDAAKLGRLVDRLWRGQVKVAHRDGMLAVRGDLALLAEVRTHLLEGDLARADHVPAP
jgi:hypothetical protein